MKVLYIGGTGEISYACVHESVRLGHDVTVFNRGRNDEPLPDSVRVIHGDLDDDDAYAKLADEGFDVVCQFLAFDLPRVERDRDVFGTRIRQYVFISSASAYHKPLPTPVITERMPLKNPFWEYSARKAAMEAALMSWHAEGRLPVTVVRPSHTYRRRFPVALGGSDFIAHRMLAGKPVIVHGDGTSLWTVTRSEDFARPFARLLGNDQALGEAYHITRDESVPWNTIMRAIGEALGVEAQLVHVPSDTLIRYEPKWTGPLLGDKAESVIFDNTKVKAIAGDTGETVDVEEGMRLSADHYRNRASLAEPDPAMDTLFDRIINDQQSLGA